MTPKTSFRATAGAVALIALAAGGASACGRAGSLERPGPMFGLARADEQPQDRGRVVPQPPPSSATGNTTDPSAKPEPGGSETSTRDDTQDDNVPTTGRDIRDPAQRLSPLSASPIPGLSDPLGPPVSTKPPG